MGTKETTAFRLNVELLEAMRQVKERDGIPVTTQVEMAVRDWLKKRGTVRMSARKAAARKSAKRISSTQWMTFPASNYSPVMNPRSTRPTAA